MRIEQNIEEKSSENLLTENGTTSGLEKPSTINAIECGDTPGPSNTIDNFSGGALEPPKPAKQRSRSNSVMQASIEKREALLL